MMPRHRLEKLTLRGFLLCVLIAAVVFDLRALMNDSKVLPACDELESVSGEYSWIRGYSTRRNGERVRRWDITLEDGTVLSAYETGGFDEAGFAEKVRYGDALTALVYENRNGVKEICELRWKDEVLHACEMPVQDMKREERRLPMFPVILLLYALIGFPVMAVKHYRKNRNRL